MRIFLSAFILSLIPSVVLLAGCSKEDIYDGQPVWPDGGQGSTEEPATSPAECDNIVVAHRGGSTEAGTGFPDNSRASLRYTMDLGCYASECDIYWTKDDNIVIAHADAECRINGLHPWEATLEELRAKGNLANGETLPTLEEFIDIVMDSDNCTRLWLDIKNITSPSTLTQYPINACRRACEIIREKKAENFVEFICTGNGTVMAESFQICKGAKVNIGWMGNKPAADYLVKGYYWANLSTGYMKQGGGDRTVEEFYDNGIEFSVYNADDDATMDYYISRADKMKAICTNYPKKLLRKME